MTEAVVGFLLENVKNVVKSQVNSGGSRGLKSPNTEIVYSVDLIRGAEEELEKLQTMLETMKAYLKELEGRAKGPVLTQLETHVREAVYTAEDIIDSSLTNRFAKNENIRNRVAGSSKNISLAKKVKEFRENKLQVLLNQTQALTAQPMGAVSAGARAETSDRNDHKTLVRENNMVGLKDEEENIIKYLEEETEEFDVISIVGMPGLGKTTLAWKIFCNDKTKLRFPTLIWVDVSQEFNVRDVFLEILKSFTKTNMSGKKIEELTQEVRSYLEKNKFLIIFDDVWTIEGWNQIKNALPNDNQSGKILITSRNANVATHANPTRKPHQLRFLNFDESWELFQREVFRKNNACPQEYEGLGKQIANDCGGVPLVVVVIGGILFDKRELWEEVSKSVTKYTQNDINSRTKNIISLSYNNLPYDMRDCFLYLGMFPEYTEIPAWKLMRLWIAEGFIQKNEQGTKSVEKVAQEYLNDLLARNLVMVEKIKANGDVKTCRVHDMIREFCKSEAGLGTKNLFQEVKKSDQGVFQPKSSETVNCRRLCIHSHVVDFIRKKVKGPKVRSLLCFSKETINIPKEDIHSIPEAFELLRVIDASPLKFAKFPPKLTKLIHLRYMSLSGNNYTALPKNTTNLLNLQTIIIDTAEHEFKINADIGRMQQLRHLKTKAAIVLEEVEGGDGGENLQTLSRLSTKSCRQSVFSRAKNLRNLGIRGNLSLLVNANYFEKLEHLEKLKLVHDTHPNTTSENPLIRLSFIHSFPPHLKILTLSSTFLDWAEMATLENLRKLEVLKLKDMAFKGNRWEVKGFQLPCLDSLHIVRIVDLQIWITLGDPFPRLKNLIIKNCKKLREIPPLLGKSLQFVEIEDVAETLVHSAQKIKNGIKLKATRGNALEPTSSKS